MPKPSPRCPFRLLVWILVLAAAHDASAQRERQTDRFSESDGARFFDQLRTLFGRFRDADLDRAFEAAEPIRCSELVSDNGAWRNVAFFNEDRKLGAWYHNSLAEVRGDLSEYIFTGSCSTDQSSVQLVTKFPVLESLERYYARRIEFDEIRIKTNPAVRASFNSRSGIYIFELPFLYADLRRSTGQAVYSLIPNRLEDRYARDVTNQWECKAVRARDLTFQFLICQTWTLPSDPEIRKQSRPSFGSYAYFILSDGKEATTSIKLNFGAEKEVSGPVSDQPSPAAAKESEPFLTWQIPDPSSKLVELQDREFRILFSPQTWTNRVSSSQVLVDQKIQRFDAAKNPAGSDYCVWRPANENLAPRVLEKEPERNVAYTLTTTEKNPKSPVSIDFDMKTFIGSRLGSLQCFFPRAESAAAISLDRWVSVVGAHLTIEIGPGR